MRCPNCKSNNIGKIANRHFYCWNCYIELKEDNEVLTMYEVDLDGTLMSLDDLFSEEERRLEG
ncbi:hypothetical protein J2T56_003036 [Natronobacillus azotifigens]|nr:hypothetical protein [Natronobacillus azotifigens]